MPARDLGIVIGFGQPSVQNSITDVPGVRVGHTTVIEGEDVRTGVTVIFPHELQPFDDPVFSGFHSLNGNGELTGLAWVRDSGFLTTAIGLTNTHSVGVVRDAMIAVALEHGAVDDSASLPVVGEIWDGPLNDINGMHVRADHVREAIATATPGPVQQGNVGGGTGAICHGFKGGIGSSSRQLPPSEGGHTVGVLVQANHGRRERLLINGVPVGRELTSDVIPEPTTGATSRGGSIIAVAATDAPLLPHQCRRVAQRMALGVARTGGAGENSSGDLFLAFATGNRRMTDKANVSITMLANERMDSIFHAVIESTEEAIVNALLAAETMTGKDDAVAYRLDPQLLQDVVLRYRPTRREGSGFVNP